MSTRVVVFVRGGMVAGITADDDVEVLIADFDVDGQDTEKRDPVDMLPVNLYRENVLVDVQRTSTHFDAADSNEPNFFRYKCKCGVTWEDTEPLEKQKCLCGAEGAEFISVQDANDEDA